MRTYQLFYKLGKNKIIKQVHALYFLVLFNGFYSD